MAVVMEMKVGNASVRVYDDAYIDATPDELKARLDEMNKVISRILSGPGAIDRLRELNKERYGIDG